MSSATRAFTLIELLVVIAIIAVLAGLAFPAYQSVQNAARKTQAKNDLVQIVTAVNAFYTDYGRYPVDSTNDVILPGTNNGSIFNELRATGQTMTVNTRQIVFLSPPEAKDSDHPKGGIKISTGEFFDPFGTTYGLKVDADYDNEVGNPYDPDTGAGSTKIRQGAIAWSKGKNQLGGDGAKTSSNSQDDIISWQ